MHARPAHGKTDDVAFDATLRAAAPLQIRRTAERQARGVAFSIESSDLHRKVRVKRAANLILFVVDASWSMAVAERMSATKGAIMSLLTDAYQRRDRVGLVVFQKNQASLVLPPTNSVQLAQRTLADIPVGGKTPLSAGLILAGKNPVTLIQNTGLFESGDAIDQACENCHLKYWYPKGKKPAPEDLSRRKR